MPKPDRTLTVYWCEEHQNCTLEEKHCDNATDIGYVTYVNTEGLDE